MMSWSKPLCILCVLCGSVLHASALDREAFTFTKYNLNVRLEPEQHRLGVRGTIILRNDSSSPQKTAVLQISSSLDWKSIKAGQQALQFVAQPYTSDIDHTGSLSEAIVTLPHTVPPNGTIELGIAYEGVIVPDATRLTRIGTPEDAARNADWDQIDSNFTAVRGAGFVAWYPIASESANLSEGNDLSEVLARWKAREADSEMSFLFESTQKATILFSGTPDNATTASDDGMNKIGGFSTIRPGTNVPSFVVADYKTIDVKGTSSINFWPGKEAAAASCADILASLDPLAAANGPSRLQVAQLPSSDAAPFVSKGLVLMPFRLATEEDRMTLVYALAKQKAASPRPWITEGLAHFAQVLDIEQQHGRKAAIDYLNAHRSLLVRAESEFATSAENASSHSLINTSDEIYLQSKAMWVWWMLHDMLGPSMSQAFSSYHAEEDKDASYMPKLIATHTQRDVEWFFDDWVYRDRGLPEFKVESAFSNRTMKNAYLLTVTVDNIGSAGAEVPLLIKFAGGEVTKRLEVRAKDKATTRVEIPGVPEEIQVNDGSIPERDTTNNTFKVPATPDKQ